MNNSTIVQGGVGGQVPWGRKLALFPCTEVGPWRGQGSWQTSAEKQVLNSGWEPRWIPLPDNTPPRESSSPSPP